MTPASNKLTSPVIIPEVCLYKFTTMLCIGGFKSPNIEAIILVIGPSEKDVYNEVPTKWPTGPRSSSSDKNRALTIHISIDIQIISCKNK